MSIVSVDSIIRKVVKSNDDHDDRKDNEHIITNRLARAL
jgi:hypothetical protein